MYWLLSLENLVHLLHMVAGGWWAATWYMMKANLLCIENCPHWLISLQSFGDNTLNLGNLHVYQPYILLLLHHQFLLLSWIPNPLSCTLWFSGTWTWTLGAGANSFHQLSLQISICRTTYLLTTFTLVWQIIFFVYFDFLFLSLSYIFAQSRNFNSTKYIHW